MMLYFLLIQKQIRQYELEKESQANNHTQRLDRHQNLLSQILVLKDIKMMLTNNNIVQNSNDTYKMMLYLSINLRYFKERF
ncbi:unnamed protein product [Paramecium octaurelia]|uniref:Uncharacterized protein n=1 Tax=Paramecium octaurelia TaxID=43137 RepID=A0A8S1YGF2_PAROT|nr:unnamed protein product [Paramecium octaurelia]